MTSTTTNGSRAALALTVLAAAAVLVTAQRTGAQPDAAPDGVRSLDVARYDDGGRLVFPDGADRWIPVGASLGSDYNEQGFDPARPGPIAVVQMEPAAYDYFRSNGQYADGTMFLLTFYDVLEKPEPALSGFVQGDVRQREIHVIDRERFVDEGRAFFVYPGAGMEAAAPLPQGSGCVECHTSHGARDATFTQFYPALR